VNARPRLGHVAALDGVRGVAIALVISTHYWGLPGGGPVGVGLFFVLSGFLITTLLLEERAETGRLALGGFYVRRARRLFPALVVLLACYLLVEGTGGLAAAAAGALYFGNISTAFAFHDTLSGTPLGHLWSLAQEEQFYFVWPLTLLLLMRARRLMLTMAVLLAALIVYRAVLGANGASVIRLYYAPDTHADWLLAGSLLAVARRRWPRLNVPEPVALAAFTTVFVGLLLNPWTLAWQEWQGVVFEAGCVAFVAAAVSRTQLAAVLSVQPLVQLGKISYSLYLWHVPVFAMLGYRHPLLALPLAVVAAAASWRFVEQPFRRRRAGPEPTERPSAASVQTA
jgi:peptidoglycan/LPS O-acetylase OafA/YrhL